MEVAIGVQFAPRELRVDTEEDPDAIRAKVEEAFEKGHKLLWLTDKKGKQIAIPVDKLAFVEVESSASEKRVGFSGRGES